MMLLMLMLGPENEESGYERKRRSDDYAGIIPQPGSNYVSISDEFYKRLEEIKKDIPADFKLDIGMDQTKFIKRSISEVEETLLIALGLVILIIYLFFRDWIIAFSPLTGYSGFIDRCFLYHVSFWIYH